MSNSEYDADASPVSLTDPESVRGRDDVPFHEESAVVDEETVETVSELDDLAPVGVTNEEEEVLLMRVTESCDRKIPAAAVEPGEEYAEAAREWVAEQAGLSIELDGIEAVHRFEARTADESCAATRYFVVYSGLPVGHGGADRVDEIPPDHDAVEVGWFDERPDDAADAPGTDVFF